MSETPGQVLARIMFGDIWPELTDEQRATWEGDAAAFLAEMLPDCWPGDDCETDDCPWCGEYAITETAARTIWLAKDAQEARR